MASLPTGSFPAVNVFLVVFQVVLVRWNEPYQKLATCDADGGIFVWIQYEGRWSVELVNDRGAQVSSGRHLGAGQRRVSEARACSSSFLWRGRTAPPSLPACGCRENLHVLSFS